MEVKMLKVCSQKVDFPRIKSHRNIQTHTHKVNEKKAQQDYIKWRKKNQNEAMICVSRRVVIVTISK